VGVFGNAIGSADGTDAFVAFKNAITQMARIAAETPLFDAESRAESLAPGWHFELTPTAEATAVGTFEESVFGGPAAGHGAINAHKNRIELNGQDEQIRKEERTNFGRSTGLGVVRWA
jgi:hypothetical protein